MRSRVEPLSASQLSFPQQPRGLRRSWTAELMPWRHAGRRLLRSGPGPQLIWIDPASCSQTDRIPRQGSGHWLASSRRRLELYDESTFRDTKAPKHDHADVRGGERGFKSVLYKAVFADLESAPVCIVSIDSAGIVRNRLDGLGCRTITLHELGGEVTVGIRNQRDWV